MNLVALSTKLILSIALLAGSIAITTECAAPKGQKTIQNYKDGIRGFIPALNDIDPAILSQAINPQELEGLQPWLELNLLELEQSLADLNFKDAQDLYEGLKLNYNAVIRYQPLADLKEFAEADAVSGIAESAAAASDIASAADVSDLGSVDAKVNPKAQKEAKQFSANDLRETTLSDADFARYLAGQNPQGKPAIAANGHQRPQHALHGNPHRGMHCGRGRGGFHRGGHRPCHGFRHPGHKMAEGGCHKGNRHAGAAAHGPAAHPHRGGHLHGRQRHGHGHKPHGCHRGHAAAFMMLCKKK